MSEVVGTKFSYWRRSYVVLPILEVEQNRMNRSQAIPGMPYLSYKASEIVQMAYAMKVVSRNNAVVALYRVKDRSAKTEVDLANKTLRDSANKGYLEMYKVASSMEYLYTLGDLGFQYLGKDKYDTDFSMQKRMKIYYTNRVFNDFCEEVKDEEGINSKGIIEWVTEPKFSDDFAPSAACIIWEDKYRRKALEARIIETLDMAFPKDQLFEGTQILKKYERIFAEIDIDQYFPIVPSVYLVANHAYKDPIKIMEDGKALVGEGDLNYWIMK